MGVRHYSVASTDPTRRKALSTFPVSRSNRAPERRGAPTPEVMLSRITKRRGSKADPATSSDHDDDAPSSAGSPRNSLCIICQDASSAMADCVTTRCGHEFHESCLERWRHECARSGQPFRCPICRSDQNHVDPEPAFMRQTEVLPGPKGIDVTFDLPFDRMDVWNEM